MNNILETQRKWIINRLLSVGEISRNECLRKFISRLSGHIYAIKEQNPTWQIEAKMVKTQGGKDYLYTLTNKDEILANLDKKLQKIGA